MPIDHAFRAASEAAHHWAELLAEFCHHAERREAPSAFANLYRLRYEILLHGGAIDAASERLAVVSDGVITHHGMFGEKGYPSAHSAVLAIARDAVLVMIDLAGLGGREVPPGWLQRFEAQASALWERVTIRESRMQAMILRERAKLLDRARSDDKASEMDKVRAVLTGNQARLWEFLARRKTCNYKGLRSVLGAWRDVPSDDAITKQLKDMKRRIEAANLPVGYITISTSKKSVTLSDPAPRQI
jgi:hypothetical protein